MGTRPDICFAVTQVAKYVNEPHAAHWWAVKRILRYLKHTSDYGIFYRPTALCKTMETLPLPEGYFSKWHPMESDFAEFYVDADFANDPDTRRSCTGYIFYLAGGPVSWQCRMQPTTALSTMEAEYMSACAATQEALYLRMVLEELGVVLDKPIILREDNKACINFADHPGEHKRTKHIDYRYHFVRERVADGSLELVYTETTEQRADIMNKNLPPALFTKHRDSTVMSKSRLSFRRR